jgi:hypothetical protein
VAVRTRVHRGNRQLKKLARASGRGIAAAQEARPASGLAATVWRQPGLWPGLAAYAAVNAVSKLRAMKASPGWGRDESSRRSRLTGPA